MTARDIFYFNTWYRGHNNARYAESFSGPIAIAIAASRPAGCR